MDPVSILGAAASAASIVQLCTESVTSLRQLQKRYKNADLTVRLLITQMSTLKTALSQISEWVEVSVDTCLPHIASDLTTSLDGCKLLIETLNDRVSRLEYDKDKAFTMRKRAQTIWGEKERTDFLSLLSHNIAALQLLLTVMQCRSQSEQTSLLQNSSNREIITKVRDETSSLLWLRDDESQCTRKSICTENSERLDSSFTFDREVFNSRAYLAALKSNMKRVVREAHSRAQAKHAPGDVLEAAFHGDEDTKTIRGDTEASHAIATNLRSSNRIRSADSDALSFEEHPSELFPVANGASGPDSQDSNLCKAPQSTQSLEALMASEKKNYNTKEANQESRRRLQMPSLLKPRSSITLKTPLDAGAHSLKSVTLDEEKLLLVGNARMSGATILRSMELAYGELQKSTAIEDDGIPEILISRKYAGIHYRYRIYDVIGLHSKENEWIYSLDEMSILIFVVDVSAYNFSASDTAPSSCIEDDLALFEKICSSKWLATTPILLLLNNADVLKSKLVEYPLGDHYPDYTGSSTDLEAAKSFFRQRFLGLNQKYGMRIHVLFTDSMATMKLGKGIVANIDKILTEGRVLAFGVR